MPLRPYTPPRPSRRKVLQAGLAFAVCGQAAWGTPTAGLPARADGELDLHHIDTGRGNCTLIVCPDGTSIMVDAGAANAAAEISSPLRPNGTRRPGEWQARYAARWLTRPGLDYFVATHIHPDHIGDMDPTRPTDKPLPYQRTGVSDVHALLPIETVLDRGFPNYGSQAPGDAPFAANYLRFLREHVRLGHSVNSANVGSTDQIRPRHTTQGFFIQILSANGVVWNSTSSSREPRLPPNTPPIENLDSVALRLTYGAFSYYTGGDLTSATNDGTQPQLDMETPVAQSAGRTEVAAVNHHGYFDACGPAFVRSLEAQAYILQTWDIGHPGPAQIERLTSSWNGHTADVFATGLAPANCLLNRRFVPRLRSSQGHIVVRVSPGGSTYRIHILDSSREDSPLLASFGPYTSRTGKA